MELIEQLITTKERGGEPNKAVYVMLLNKQEAIWSQ